MQKNSGVSEDVREFSFVHSDSSRVQASAVLVHGLTGSPAEMRTIARLLHEQHFNVIVPRLSGHGETIDALRGVRPATWFRDVARAVEVARSFERPVFLAGLSFGALLAIRAYQEQQNDICGLVLASCPVRLEPPKRDILLSILSYLPEQFLDLLWVQRKKKRREGYLLLEHPAYRKHSVGAAARLVKIRRSVMRDLAMVKVPVLLLQDPLDHHLPATASIELQAKLLHAECRCAFFPDGQHEIFLGHAYEEVNREIVAFCKDVLVRQSDV